MLKKQRKGEGLKLLRAKGISTVLLQVLVGLLTIGICALLVFFIFGKYFDIHLIVLSSEVERHTINLAQLLLSSEYLVYGEDGIFNKSYKIFDRNKLDLQLGTSISTLTKDSEINREIGYPNSVHIIYVEDFSNNKKWFLVGGSSTTAEEFSAVEYINCLISKLPSNIFDIAFPYIWDKWDVYSCELRVSKKIGTFVKSFPVAIRDGDETHLGRLTIRLIEV